MTTAVEMLTAQVRSLPDSQFDEFLTWLADYELTHMDEWDRQIERDTASGGALGKVLSRVNADIASGRTKPLDSVLDDA